MRYDAVVIGASSAGLHTAEILAKHGKQVALYDQAESFFPALRTYIITMGLKRVIPDLVPELIRHEIKVLQVQAGKESADIQLSSPDLIVERSQLLSILLNRAKIAGVHINFQSKFHSLATGRNGTEIKIISNAEEQLIRADYLIGADGISSSVGIAAGLPSPQSVPLLQAEINLPPDWDPDVTKIWFEVKDTPYFYWLIPDAADKGVVGLIAEPGADIRKLLRSFLEEKNIQPLDYQSGQAALYSPDLSLFKQVGDLKILLVGDAAGQVKVTTVGGTVTGLSGGHAAAESILEDMPYQKTQLAIGKELNLHYFIRQLLNKMEQEDYVNLVGSLTPTVQSFLGKYDRDSMRRHFWKLPFIQSRLIPLGLKLLVSSG